MIQLLLASRNRHKIREIRQILGERVRVWSMDDMVAAPELVEDADSFTGNAARKARQLADWVQATPDKLTPWDGRSPLMILADDSGLEVAALDGAPGVHSARFASLGGSTGGNASDQANNERLIQLLAGVPVERRQARFRCVLAAIRLWPRSTGPQIDVRDLEAGSVCFFEGACDGFIEMAPRGKEGFGYDPLFRPGGYDGTFAELTEETKNRLSHRFKALERFRVWLETEIAGPRMPEAEQA